MGRLRGSDKAERKVQLFHRVLKVLIHEVYELIPVYRVQERKDTNWNVEIFMISTHSMLEGFKIWGHRIRAIILDLHSDDLGSIPSGSIMPGSSSG